MDEQCVFETHRADRNGPAENCADDTVPGTEFCEKHQPHNMEPDPDAARDDADHWADVDAERGDW